MLGIALTYQGKLEEALFYFEQIANGRLTRFEEPFYATSYAYLLSRLGRLSEAQQVIRNSPRRRWTKKHEVWANAFLAARPRPEPPPITGMKPRRRLLH